MPWLMNGPLVVLAIGAVLAGFACKGWITTQIGGSTAAAVVSHDEHTLHAVHTWMAIISSVIAIGGIALAAWFHWLNREAATKVAGRFAVVVRVLENKWYVDELYDAAIVKPLRLMGELCFAFDRLVIEPLVSLPGVVLRWVGKSTRPAQAGVLQGYGLSMVIGTAVVVVVVLWRMMMK